MRSIKRRSRLKSFGLARLSEVAQATTEYILVLAVVVALALAVLKPLRAFYEKSLRASLERSINKRISENVYCFPVNGSCQ